MKLTFAQKMIGSSLRITLSATTRRQSRSLRFRCTDGALNTRCQALRKRCLEIVVPNWVVSHDLGPFCRGS